MNFTKTDRSLWIWVKFHLLHSPFRLKYQSDRIFFYFFFHISIIWQNYVLKNCNTMRCRIYAEIVPSKIYTSSSNDCEMELSILINCQKSCKSKPLYSVGVSHKNNMYKSSLAQPFQPPFSHSRSLNSENSHKPIWKTFNGNLLSIRKQDFLLLSVMAILVVEFNLRNSNNLCR